MAYSDYGAFVYLNRKRVEENEDCERFGQLYHGVIDDGKLIVLCYKQGLPTIYYEGKQIEYYDKDKVDFFDYGGFECEIHGYVIRFESGCDVDYPYVVEVVCPNKDLWRCEYDYWWGSSFEDEVVVTTGWLK